VTSGTAEVISVNVSTEKGTPKRPVAEVTLDGLGVVGDAHAGPWHRQVSLLGQESIDRFARESGRSVSPGEFAENLTLRGIDLSGVALMDRFRAGPAELEVTQIGKECHGEGCAIFREVGKCVMPSEGIFCRVLKGGTVRPGDAVEREPYVLRLQVITLSDRASRGDYEDRSGPTVAEALRDFAGARRWEAAVRTTVLPDDADRLLAALAEARDMGCDAVFTTGGTGVGPRDITPDVVASFCDKTIPGIMDSIRIKCGARNPRALLSRSIAGLAGRTLVFALPGSVRAVGEYMGEILAVLEHLILTVHGVDAH
jgi:molybdenum cofactor synthesis domain-containing protein